ncbi:hypothetical protein D1953_10240 [Peribacillus asahii]|uniref:Uncharacterized protein n=1 Tax=Peribacillus asahii TaxID=228899 RepID=A0A398B8F2_9BACI|nr:hypothetical protein D1953_10240 [Peribacillus asahii]
MRMPILLLINLLLVMVTVLFYQTLFQLIIPFLLLIINYQMALRKDKSYFISNFFLVLIGSVIGEVLNGGLRSPDYETYAIAMFVLKFDIIVSVIGSLLCSTILIVKYRKKHTF